VLGAGERGDGGGGEPKPLRRRLAQLAWIIPHLDDIASDMSVFHRVDDITVMPGRAFFRLAYRLPAYEGVMRARVLAEQEDQQPRSDHQPAAPRPQAREINPGTQATLQGDPAFAGIFSFGVAGGG